MMAHLEQRLATLEAQMAAIQQWFAQLPPGYPAPPPPDVLPAPAAPPDATAPATAPTQTAAEPVAGAAAPPPTPGHTFWALEELKQQVPDGPGAVLYTGAVRLGEQETYEWQYGIAVAQLLDSDWSPQVRALSALAHPVRLRLLREVLGGRRTAAALAGADGLGTTGQLYHHLRQLVAAGWLRHSDRGSYQLPPQRVVPLLVVLAAASG